MSINGEIRQAPGCLVRRHSSARRLVFCSDPPINAGYRGEHIIHEIRISMHFVEVVILG